MVMEKINVKFNFDLFENFEKYPSPTNPNKFNKLNLSNQSQRKINEGRARNYLLNHRNKLAYNFGPIYINNIFCTQNLSKPTDIIPLISYSPKTKMSYRDAKISSDTDHSSMTKDFFTYRDAKISSDADLSTISTFSDDIVSDKMQLIEPKESEFMNSANIIEDELVKQLNSLAIRKEVDIILLNSQIDSQTWEYTLKNLGNVKKEREASRKSILQNKLNLNVQSLLVPKAFEIYEEELELDILYLRESTGQKNRHINLPIETYPCLTNTEESRLYSILSHGSNDEVISQAFGINIKRSDLHTLNHINWLNDEVINFYLNMIVERSEKGRKVTEVSSLPSTFPSTKTADYNDNTTFNLNNTADHHSSPYPTTFTFNTFFFTQLTNKGYASVKRWTKKVDIFSKELLFVPVHIGAHWCMAIIDFKFKVIIYFDSLYSDPHEYHLQLLKDYLEQESLDKKKSVFDMSDWKLINSRNAPQQYNGSDCGVFSLKYAEFISRRENFTFTQANMNYFRKRLILEISDKSFYKSSSTTTH